MLTRRIGRWIKQKVRRHGYDIVRHVEISEWLKLHRIDMVIDIGANDGRYATEVREAGWEGRITSFEPQPTAFSRLQERMSKDRHWSGHQLGLGSSDGTLSFNSYSMDVLGSFLQKKELDQNSVTIEVEVCRPETIWEDLLGSPRRPFVKIDTQGYELEIIRGFGERAKDVVGWQLELSVEQLYEGQPYIDEVIGAMRMLGCPLWRILPGLRDPRTLQAFELDGIFFRTN